MKQEKPETREIPKTIEELELFYNIARRQERKRLRGICDICAKTKMAEGRRQALEEAEKMIDEKFNGIFKAYKLRNKSVFNRLKENITYKLKEMK